MTDLEHVSSAPTRPQPSGRAEARDPFALGVDDLFGTPVAEAGPDDGAAPSGLPLDEKLRQAYFWVVNHAIISPHYDVEFAAPGARETSVRLGDSKALLSLPSDQSYSSFVLLPLLTFAVRGRCLMIGGPGRGKTASAVLMGVLAGYPVRDVRRAMQHGHPQLTVSDLFGTPLPKDLVQADSLADVDVAWRSWLGMRVKIVDEYNRIPTRTQSALLTVMGDNYAEVLGQVFECPDSARFLTANDDQGGGTYQVIEALRDRIDVVVQALAFNPRFLSDLMTRIEENVRPEELVPRQIIFDETEMDRMQEEIREVELGPEVRRRLEFFASQFEFCEVAAEQFEYKTKDTARLAAVEWHTLATLDSGRDRLKDLGCQTKNGLSVRALMTLILYSKAIAYFRGNRAVELADVRQILPFVLHDKLVPDAEAPFFDAPGNGTYRSDRIGWLRKLFDASLADYDRLDLDRQDPLGELAEEFRRGLEGLPENEVRTRLSRIERLIVEWGRGKKLYGHLYDDLLKLKYLHQRYTNYLRWLATQ